MPGEIQLSYSHGASTHPLLGETIGANLERTVARVPDREALVDCPSGAAVDLRRARRRGRRGRARACSRRARARATGSASGRRTAPSGCSCSTRPRRSARSSSTSTRPTGPRAAVRRSTQSGMRLLVRRGEHKTSDYRAMVEQVPRRDGAPALRARSVFIGERRAGPALVRGRRPDPHRPAGCSTSAMATPVLRRPDQHPVHVAARPASRRAPRSRTTTSSTTATSSASCSATPSTTGVCIPVPFYHCFGMVMGNLGVHHARRRRSSSRRRRSTRPPTLRAVAGRALHRRSTACRRCSSPSSSTRLRRATTCRRCAPGSWPARRARSR